MITSLQNFISSKGKFVFVLLLFLVVVSFVLYLSQGSSVFDLLPDPNRETQEFYGHDWKDPDQRRLLNIASRVSADFGSVVSPGGEILQTAQEEYMQSLQRRMQAAFQANPDEVDQEGLQQMFSYMQAWPNFPDDMKAREIARSGNYDQSFLQSMVEFKVALGGQANSWDFMPLNLNHPAINARFAEYLQNLAPGMNQEENRSHALTFVGGRYGVSSRYVESILYDSFRTRQVERIYLDGGFALEEEARLDLHSGQFAWDGEVAELYASDLTFDQPAWRLITFKSLPMVQDSLALKSGSQNIKFVFGEKSQDKNETTRHVRIGKNLSQFRNNLIAAFQKEDCGFDLKPVGKNGIALLPQANRLPRNTPELSVRSKHIDMDTSIDKKLREFHSKRVDEAPFAEAPRTFATATLFSSSNYFIEPPVPDEARLRAYYERNQLDFIKSTALSNGNDQNASSDQNVTAYKSFEEVKDEILEKVISQDREDARKDSDLQARDAALSFLDQLNGLRDKARTQFSNYLEFRNSDELAALIEQAGARPQKISFSNLEMGTQAMILGLERRESERQSNREPLEEVASLNERMFFTRSVRKARQGYVVFILDRKTPQQPGSFERASFADLYRGYTAEFASNYFSEQIEAAFSAIQTDKSKAKSLPSLQYYAVSAKSSGMARSTFDAEARSIRNRIQELEEKKNAISVKDSNSSKDKSIVDGLDKRLSGLRTRLEDHNKERTAILRLLDTAHTLQVNGTWQELERNEDRAVFAKLSQVYSLRGKEAKAEAVTQRRKVLEANRGQDARDSILQDLIVSSLGTDR